MDPRAKAILDCVTSPPVFGTRFHHQGRLPGVRLDCIGLLVVGALAGGWTLDDRVDYPWHASGGRLLASIEEQFVRVDGGLDAALPADVLLFWVSKRRKEPRHVAFFECIGTPEVPASMIHTSIEAGKVVRWPIDEPARERLVGVWRLPGMHSGVTLDMGAA